MRVIKVVASIFFIGVIASCNTVDTIGGTVSEKKYSYVHSVVDSLKIDRSKNILIYTINPNDCINCLIGFVSLNNGTSKIINSKVYVISVEREIEKNQLLKIPSNSYLKDTIGRSILWDKNIFIDINKSTSIKKAISLSSLTIYNYLNDSIIYNKPIKEIISKEEFEVYLDHQVN